MSSNPRVEPSLLEFAVSLSPMIADYCAQDLAGFVKETWPILYPGRTLTWSWHYDFLCEILTLVKRRKIRRVIINIPPRTLKSTLVTILFPAWVWLTEPSHHFLTASYSMDLSSEHSDRRRHLMQSERFRALWGDRFQLSGGRNLVTYYQNNCGGQMIATSVGATAMGRGCDTAILDDPVSANQALSDVERSSANNWIDGTLRSRLNDPGTGAIVIVMQRLHQLDPTGFLLEQEPGVWMHISISLEAEEDTFVEFPISGRVICRKKGDVLLPKRFPPAVVQQLHVLRQLFAGQYQQRPAPVEGNLIRWNDARYFGGIDPRTGQLDERLPDIFDLKIVSVDCSFKKLATCDYTAIIVIGVKGPKRYVLDVVNEHLDATGTENAIRRLRAQHGSISAVLIEDKANGPAIIERLKADIPGVLSVNPLGGKEARMAAAAVEWRAGNWYVDRRAGWRDVFLEQLVTFPNCRNNDMVDAMSQAASWLVTFQMPSVEIYSAIYGRGN